MSYRTKLISNCVALSKSTNAQKALQLSQQVVIRNYAAAAAPKASQKPKKDEKPVESTSFALNLFRGQLKLDEVFPYPIALNDEQRENLQALVDPTAKFFEVFDVHFFIF